ncbi:dicarboxylate/amino acid:cation symporter [Alkaliphilus oremlandii]|uniref:Sodium:dicarboxylate symporter n=1 Tax=Alkaliphilus oremlandii (strain OhILAs) TaxID=350688 RepID=A8MF42_ALKOO|nr:dicarboxylate/amino acid:cation symporter [Alkaliphilus oremlandii]ABW18711.1 sodium:dicarboxylate symporter [Alkaliphilus oremlandii OhILAs]
MKKLGLLPRLLIGIVIGILIGATKIEILTRLLMTFSGIFGEFLNYIIPLLIIAFVAPGIAELGDKAGRLLGITAGLAYISTVIAGTMAYLIATAVLPILVPSGANIGTGGIEISAIFTLQIPPILPVMSALITAFLLGLGMAAIKSTYMIHLMKEFEGIISKVIDHIIIPLLPIYIAGIFANMAYTGEVMATMSVFGKVFLLVIAMHILIIVIQFIIAGSISSRNPFASIKNMLPAYFTAIGTQSSAATIPVTVASAKKNGVSDEVAEFAVPLCATIHLSGSTITITTCALAVILIQGTTVGFGQIFPFVLMLGVTMVAAPGVPGGAIMAALGLLSTMLGFTEAQLGLMMALYIAQDSFGTACNVTGDAAIAMIVDRFAKKS